MEHNGAMANEPRSTPFDRMLLPVDTVVQHVISRIDVNAIIEQVDVNAILDQVDVNEIIKRVDLEAVVERSIRRATRRTLDLARAVAANLDEQATDVVDRVLRRPPGWRPRRPVHAPVADTQ
jgi:hypothetical protein